MKKQPSDMPAPKDEMPVKPKYEEIGVCGFCLGKLESLQPGGAECRHMGTEVPYGECDRAKRARSQFV